MFLKNFDEVKHVDKKYFLRKIHRWFFKIIKWFDALQNLIIFIDKKF